MSFQYSRDLSNLPPKIRCDVGKEWKTPDCFSKTKLNQFANNLRKGTKVTAARSGIACRVHSGEPDTTMQCAGPCGKIYGLDCFSRNTRVNRKNWCNYCTDWQLKNEPGFLPYPVPYAVRTGDEHLTGQGNDDATSKAEGTARDDDTYSAALSVDHARSVVAETYLSGVTFGGPTGSSAVPTVAGSVYSEDTYRTGAGGQEFNAWAPNGVVHRITKAATVISERATVTSVDTEVTVAPNGWVRPSQRKTPADMPAYIKYGMCKPTIDDDYRSNDGLSDDEM